MRRTILFVDDELINLFVLEKRFEGEYNVLTAESGEEALEKIKLNKGSLDAIITDLKMPGMDGLQLINQVKPAIINIPCFLLTGFERMEQIDMALSTEKIQHMFKKPFDYEEIDSKLKESLH
ncbi:response regulator [Ekhidna sp.]|uniref:response regulator n=1 Tax=Ekhidna sp. TaxID=2608089 RepID=UPI003B5B729A